jgi:hypothetical protein
MREGEVPCGLAERDAWITNGAVASGCSAMGEVRGCGFRDVAVATGDTLNADKVCRAGDGEEVLRG